MRVVLSVRECAESPAAHVHALTEGLVTLLSPPPPSQACAMPQPHHSHTPHSGHCTHSPHTYMTRVETASFTRSTVGDLSRAVLHVESQTETSLTSSLSLEDPREGFPSVCL